MMIQGRPGYGRETLQGNHREVPDLRICEAGAGEPRHARHGEDPRRRAHEHYLAAESLWVAAQDVPVEEMSLVDSAYGRRSAPMIPSRWRTPDTRRNSVPFMKAVIFEMTPSGRDSATAIYKNSASDFGQYALGRGSGAAAGTTPDHHG